jgi:hypothetical protein
MHRTKCPQNFGIFADKPKTTLCVVHHLSITIIIIKVSDSDGSTAVTKVHIKMFLFQKSTHHASFLSLHKERGEETGSNRGLVNVGVKFCSADRCSEMAVCGGK